MSIDALTAMVADICQIKFPWLALTKDHSENR
jgi:hypothetical protein